MPAQGKGRRSAKFALEMSKFKHHTLHSGSKKGPVVRSAAQAKAIACHVSGSCGPRRKKR